MKQTINAPPGPGAGQKELLERILQFPIDDRDAAFPFSRKLERENRWSAAFTRSAIAEYRKFLFLCCISPHGATPSETVDEVWHLHLQYTQNYWNALCRNTLHREIHHYPANGPAEKAQYERAYQETLTLYCQVFGHAPPPDIWPAGPTLHQQRFSCRQLLFSRSKLFALLVIFFLSGCNNGSIIVLLLLIPELLLVLIRSMIYSIKGRHKEGHQYDGGNGGGCGSSGGCSNGGCSSNGGCGSGCGGCGGGS